MAIENILRSIYLALDNDTIRFSSYFFKSSFKSSYYKSMLSQTGIPFVEAGVYDIESISFFFFIMVCSAYVAIMCLTWLVAYFDILKFALLFVITIGN